MVISTKGIHYGPPVQHRYSVLLCFFGAERLAVRNRRCLATMRATVFSWKEHCEQHDDSSNRECKQVLR